MSYIIDRIESGIALCECMSTGEKIEINEKSLPKTAREGDVIHQEGENAYIVDTAMTEQRLAALTARMNSLFMRDL